MWKKILAVVALLIVAFLGAAATRPNEFKVARSIVIDATPDKVFPMVNVLKLGSQWRPWDKLDPKMKTTFSGPESGVGASYSWDGNNEVGAGSLTIVESKPNELVRNKLEFLRPMAGVSDVAFTLEPLGSRTKLSWSMQGESCFMGKCMSLVMDCEAMCGQQFDQGLASLKKIVESGESQR